ncbi:molybdopterin synthase sulfur carrier subunit [Euryarchaeota archaeon ex4484_178]|nr:MAG: molybdopterin synthase sulfur carrier subunit [Euryarchaeota archaeon ex4484_178]
MPKIRFFATLRDITGIREMEIKGVDNIQELLQILYEKFGDRFRKEIEEKNMILVNGRNILDLQGYETEIGENDEIAIFPPVGGG